MATHKIYVEDKILEIKGELTVFNVLQVAQEQGIFAAQDGPEKLSLKGKESGKIYVGEDVIDIADDKNFSIGVAYPFTVGDQQFISPAQKVVASDLINMARAKGVIPPDGNWKLEADGKDASFEGRDWVDLGQFNVFFPNLSGPTPTA